MSVEIFSDLSPLLFPFAAAFLGALLLHGTALRVFPKIGLLDFPERYGYKRSRLPYPTGIITVFLFCLFFAMFEEWSLLTAGVLAGILLLAVFTFIDDRRPLSPILRILVQILVATILFATGARIYSITNPVEGFLGTEAVINLSQWIVTVPVVGSLPLLSGLFTILWLGLTINALNWFDGIPGQVSVISIIGFLTIGFLSLGDRVQDPHLAMLALILAALSLGSLFFEFPPPRVLQGDTGAMFSGLMLGVLTIYAGQGKVATAFLVLGVPLIDLGIVIVRRLLKGSSPLRGNTSDEHLHHRLLQKGWSHKQVILLTASLGSLFGISALFLSTREKFFAALLLLLIMLGLSHYSRPKNNY